MSAIVIAGSGSSFAIAPCADPRFMNAFRVLVRLIVNVSLGSNVRSPKTETPIFALRPPAAILTGATDGSKSEPEEAVPLTIEYETVTGFVR